MTDLRSELVELAARAWITAKCPDRDFAVSPFYQEELAAHRVAAQAAVTAVLARAAVPTAAMWGGLARQIMMWMDFGPGERTPRTLFRHLARCGQPIPQWLRDEAEMSALDHMPSKGTRAVILYRAMIDAVWVEG